jgi:hypothetical protein
VTASSIVNAEHTIVDRKVGDLSIDPNVQRAMKKGRVDKIAADFHPEALGVLTTSYREPGIIHVVDGQHRYRAAEAAGYQGPIKTNEYRGLTLAQEAALFSLLNNTEKVGPIDQFLVACVEGRPSALALARILKDNGWAVSTAAGKGKISAIRSLERVYNLGERGPWAAAATIAVLTSAWGHVSSAVNGSLIEGLGRMLAKYGEDVDLTDLGKRLSNSPGGADALLGYCRGQKLSRTGNLNAQVARAIVGIYNERRRSTKLPEWQ